MPTLHVCVRLEIFYMPVLKANKMLRSAFDRETKNTQIRELCKKIQPSDKDVAVLSAVSRQYFERVAGLFLVNL